MAALTVSQPDETAPVPAQPTAAVPQFDAVFAEFAPYVLRVLPRLGIFSRDVDDVAQEVFLAIYRGLPSFAGRSTVKTWVYGVCIHVSRNHRRRAYHAREQLAQVDEGVDSGTPANDLEARRALVALDAALAGLSEVQRSVFVLHQIEDLSVLEIAQVLVCSKFTVYARLYAARRAVLTALGEPARAWLDTANTERGSRT